MLVVDFPANARDLVVDESALDKASQDFGALAEKVQALRSTLEGDVQAMMPGYDTPAGRAFQKCCNTVLLEKLDALKNSLTELAEKLGEAKSKYQPVFSEYEKINKEIGSYQT